MPVQEKMSILTVTEENIILTRKTLGLTEKGLQEDINAIIDWFQKQPHLVDAGINRSFIERMLVINKGSREKTKKRIDNYYKYRGYAPDLVQDRHIQLANHSREPWSFFIQTLIPKLYEGKRITVTKYTDPNASNFFLDDMFRSALMFSDVRLTHDYMVGDIWIIDFKPLSFSHVLRLNPVVLQKTANIFQEGIGMKVSEIYVLNSMAIFESVINVLKNFLKPKILDRIIITQSLDDLHKCIPKEYLPKDYGGDLPSMEEFKEANVKAFATKEMREYLKENSKQVSNEKLRPGYDLNEDALAGSFKKMDFD